MENMLQMIYETLTQHIPQHAVWMTGAGIAALAIVGLLLLVKGARLAPLMSALAFLAIGGVAGSFAAHWLGTPAWATIGVTALFGFGLGLVLFKVWLAALVAACFIGCSLSLYGVKVLTPHLADYASSNCQTDEGGLLVTLPDAGAPVTVADSPQAELGRIWSYLGTEVPSFVTSFWAIVISTGLAGLILGLLLPRFSRALLAATAGTLFFCTGLVVGLDGMWPSAMAWIRSIGAWQWVLIVVIWGVSLAHNLIDVRGKRLKTARRPRAPEGKPAPA